jgi:hypothetical protein
MPEGLAMRVHFFNRAVVALLKNPGGSPGYFPMPEIFRVSATGDYEQPKLRWQGNDVATAGLIENCIDETERCSWFLTEIGRAQWAFA